MLPKSPRLRASASQRDPLFRAESAEFRRGAEGFAGVKEMAEIRASSQSNRSLNAGERWLHGAASLRLCVIFAPLRETFSRGDAEARRGMKKWPKCLQVHT